MEEIWKDILGYEGHYQVSNIGRVKSIKKMSGRIKLIILSPSLTADGYPVVSLRMPKTKRKCMRVHRLVALHFLYKPNDKTEVNHIDGIKKNNHVNNLEWVTGLENIRHAYSVGLSTNGALILDIETGIYYESCKNAWLSSGRNIKKTTFSYRIFKASGFNSVNNKYLRV